MNVPGFVAVSGMCFPSPTRGRPPARCRGAQVMRGLGWLGVGWVRHHPNGESPTVGGWLWGAGGLFRPRRPYPFPSLFRGSAPEPPLLKRRRGWIFVARADTFSPSGV
ncbi:hypothetical protein GCM10010306_008380 [Streptomyces umbrinus]|nr:hypothetical protein GCM10010306_008380 [Streptomyces umbrinus]